MTECPLCWKPMDDYSSKCSWCLELEEDEEDNLNIKPIYPQSWEAYSAFNTLIGYCVGRWMPVRDYDNSDDLLYAMRWPIRELHSIVKQWAKIKLR